MMDNFIGIDFGTCNSSAAWFNPRTGQAESLLSAEGDDKTPSVVYFGPGETVVGRHADERLLSPKDWKRVVSAVKRDLAKLRTWVVGDRHVAPLDAATVILEKIKRDAEDGHFHAPVMRAVITCPAVFDEAEKDKLREAAKRAGFRNVELLEEPVAAAVAYVEAGIKVGRYVLVYDLGGGTFDLALLTREEGDDAFRLAMEPRGEKIGGEDFDKAIYDFFDAGILKTTKQPISPDGLDRRLLRQCRTLKESLTASKQPPPLSWDLPSIGPVKLRLNQATFESLVENLVDQTVRLTRSIQEDAAARGYQLDSVILIGGSSRIPCIERCLHEELQVEPRKWQKQDVAVALGAAYHAQRLWGERPSAAAAAPPSEPSVEAQSLFARARDRFDEATKSEAEVRRQHLDAALQHAQAACELEQGWPDAFQLKGQILQEKGDWLLAMAAYTASLRLDPSAARAQECRGLCKFMAGDSNGAIKDLDEALRLRPTEFAYRYRAATHLRLDNVAAAVFDIEKGLKLADQETPRAALHAVNGLLVRDQLDLPGESLGCFAEALRHMGPVEGSLERRQFLMVGILFDVPVLMKAQPAEDRPKAGRFNLLAWVKQELSLISTALHYGGAREAVVEFVDRNLRQRIKVEPPADRPKAGRRNLVAWVQKELWQTCQALHGGCTREAALEFFDRNPRETAEGLWKKDPELVLHLATIWAEKQNPGNTIDWLKNLLSVEPLFDIRRARRDPWISPLQDPELLDFLTPKYSFEEYHGGACNWLTVTNRNAFRLTALQVRVHVTRRNGEEDEPIALQLESLDSGASHRWPAVFVAPGWFRQNITGVRVTLGCAEGKAKLFGSQSEPDSEKDHRKTNPKDEILDVLLVDEPSDDSPVRKQRPRVHRPSSREV